ncbi:hypothetical protein AAVH_18499 [Aphelenchoides avenae]|nr:hypothetical protein AAVH_18499 [Aphelenchus avenae]
MYAVIGFPILMVMSVPTLGRPPDPNETTMSTITEHTAGRSCDANATGLPAHVRVERADAAHSMNSRYKRAIPEGASICSQERNETHTTTVYCARLNCIQDAAWENGWRCCCVQDLVAKERQECEEYKELDKGLNCGPDGYMLGYGHKYCNRFYDKYTDFDRLGQATVSCTAKCLLDKLRPAVAAEQQRSREDSCGRLKVHAYDSHVGCYVDCGFCLTFVTNPMEYFGVIDRADLNVSTVSEIGGKCAGGYIELARRLLSREIHQS